MGFRAHPDTRIVKFWHFGSSAINFDGPFSVQAELRRNRAKTVYICA